MLIRSLRLATTTWTRSFTTTGTQCSKIGRMAVSLPPNCSITQTPPPPRKGRVQEPGKLTITGPLGTLHLSVPEYLTVAIDTELRKVSVSPQNVFVRQQRERWGTIRAMIQNHVTGVSEGHAAILRLVGVGYRASIEDNGRIVNLKVQYAHPVELVIPEGVKASTPQPTRILLEGIDKEVVKQFAADIRAWRKPEPYKGKGIFVNDETIKLKARKIK